VALRNYFDAASIADDRKGYMLRMSPHHAATKLIGRPTDRPDAWCMTRRRAAVAGITAPTGNHNTAYIDNDGALEHLQTMAGQENPCTTRFYDSTNQPPTQAAVAGITSRHRAIHLPRLPGVFSTTFRDSPKRCGPF